MSPKPITNLAQSVWTRLLNRAKARREDPSFTLLRYAGERLLYRLSISDHASRFVLKGAMLFAAWAEQPHRSTKDVDLLGHGDPEQLVTVFREVCAIAVQPDDAVRFEAESVQANQIRDDEEYDGRRVLLGGWLGKMPLSVQVDVGFGDVVTPAPIEMHYPVLLEQMPAPWLRTYPPETVIAEKFEAMVKLGIANTRMKDFYDIWVLSHLRSFALRTLRLAARETFTRRGTAWPPSNPIALTGDFSGEPSKQTQWRAFLNRTRPAQQPTLDEVVNRLRTFLGRLGAYERGSSADSVWSPERAAWTVH